MHLHRTYYKQICPKSRQCELEEFTMKGHGLASQDSAAFEDPSRYSAVTGTVTHNIQRYLRRLANPHNIFASNWVSSFLEYRLSVPKLNTRSSLVCRRWFECLSPLYSAFNCTRCGRVQGTYNIETQIRIVWICGKHSQKQSPTEISSSKIDS